MDQPRALRELQAALQLRIDALYVPLPPQVRRIIRRHTSRGVLSLVGASLAYAEIRRLLESVDDRTAPLIAQGVAAVAVIAQQDEPDIDAAWGLAAGALAARYLYGVQQTLRGSRERSVDQVRRVLLRAAQTSRPEAVITLHLEQYVNPWYATRRDAGGALRRVDRTGARVSGPAVPGMAASPARGIMLTETSTAHGEWAIVKAQQTPGALVRWRLSPFHRDVDICDNHARRDNGWGPGIYVASTVPRYPTHPRCACILDVVIPRQEAAA